MKNCVHIVFDYRNLPAAKERRIDHGLRKACRQQDARPEDRGNRVCRSVCVPIFVPPPPIPAFFPVIVLFSLYAIPFVFSGVLLYFNRCRYFM